MCEGVDGKQLFNAVSNTMYDIFEIQRLACNSWSLCLSASASSARLYFGTFGVANCLWNSRISVAAENICAKRRIAALIFGTGSFFFHVIIEMRRNSWTIQINTRTESRGNAAPIQPCAPSIIKAFENLAVFSARQNPAHRAPESLEWMRELSRADHFCRWGDGLKHAGERAGRTEGKNRTELASEASWC